MRLKSKLKTFLKRKSKGNIILSLGVMLPLILILLFFIISIFIFGEQAATIKDKADFSNLATYKDINQESLSSEGKLTFETTDLNNALATYIISLKDNFKLDSNLNILSPDSFIKGTVTINKLILCKVKDNLTSAWEYNGSTGNFKTLYTSTATTINTPSPNNKIVKNTSVYSEIVVPIDIPFVGLQNITVRSYTDVVN